MKSHDESDSVRGWRRLWRPSHPAFWIGLLLNGLSSAMVLAHQALSLQGWLSLLVLGVALTNSLLGLWWLKRLWQDDVPPGTKV